MVILAISMIIVGAMVGLFGFKLFRILLPLAGLLTGLVVGFTGFQSVFGTGVVSSTVAVLVALFVGLLMGLLAFAFFDVALIVFSVVVGAALFQFLGVALGLGNVGFIMFLLALAGGIMGFVFSTSRPIVPAFIISLTSILGVSLVFGGIMLITGNISLDQIHNTGVIRTVILEVDQSFLWLFLWVSLSVVTMYVQRGLLLADLVGAKYEYSKKN